MQRPQGPPPPFSCTYTPQVPELLWQMQVTLALSTYQAGKLIFLSPKPDQESLTQLPRNFEKAMGIARGPNGKLALATRDEVILFSNSPGLAEHYPRKPDVYDALFLPRAIYYPGQIDIHDLDWSEKGMFAVNTSFSCLIRIDENYSFTPWWTPPFIDNLQSEDRCHLNGMAMDQGLPRYATAFNKGNSPQSWRERITETGILMDIPKNEIMVEGLSMPHSPRLFDGRLFLLLSGTGDLVEVFPEEGRYEVLYNFQGFVRGLARHGDYLFIGLSKLRKNSSTFAKLAIADLANRAGIAIFHVPTLSMVGEIIYKTSVDEIYDVQVLPGMVRPNIMNPKNEEHKLGLMIPGATYWAKPNQES